MILDGGGGRRLLFLFDALPCRLSRVLTQCSKFDFVCMRFRDVFFLLIAGTNVQITKENFGQPIHIVRANGGNLCAMREQYEIKKGKIEWSERKKIVQRNRFFITSLCERINPMRCSRVRSRSGVTMNDEAAFSAVHNFGVSGTQNKKLTNIVK